MRISRVLQSIPPSGIRRFFDIVSQMEAVIYSLEHGYTQYTSNWGLLELRQEIARLLDRRYGVEYRPEGEIVVTVGESEGLDLALRAILNPGDEVIIPEPCYVSYRPCTLLAGGVPVTVGSSVENGFRVDVERLEAAVTPRTRAILLNYPNNPTGATLRRGDLERIAAVAERHDLIVISDEIYSELTYDGAHLSFAALPGMQNRTVLLNGFSKAY